MTLIRLIITDMDGTLLHGDKSMPAGTLELIRELHARGIVLQPAAADSMPRCGKALRHAPN